jgi:hypothetical protein
VAEEESEDGSDAESPDETEEKIGPDRGYFVDVKTLAAALTSKSHSLASLSDLLKVPTPKEESDEHGGTLTPEYVRYGLRDVQTTWECFDNLARRFATFQLHETGLYELYSEASLGKAYLRAMGLKPWQEVQRGFPLHLVGAIMSAYFGGRAEVHIRRQITPVVHTDFLSMYPTVCTLMGLWSFVRAEGMTHHDDTNVVTALVARPREELAAHLRKKDGWKDLASLVQVRPGNNLLPVRAKYPGGDTLNIGLNYLSADEPQWFTLADVLASKVLTGRAPEVIGRILVDSEGSRIGDMRLRHGLAKEPLGRGRISPRSQKEIDRLPSAVHRPIEIRPASLHPNVGFVHPPGAVAGSGANGGIWSAMMSAELREGWAWAS